MRNVRNINNDTSVGEQAPARDAERSKDCYRRITFDQFDMEESACEGFVYALRSIKHPVHARTIERRRSDWDRHGAGGGCRSSGGGCCASYRRRHVIIASKLSRVGFHEN